MKRVLVVFAVLAAMLVVAAPRGVDAKSAPTCKGKTATQWLTSPGTLSFTDGDDVFVGSSGDDFFLTGDWGGNDLVCAGGGDDEIHASGWWSDVYAGTGNDSIWIDGGNAYGESGDDWISAAYSNVYGGSGNDYIEESYYGTANGGSGNDEIYGWYAASLLGGAGNDYVQSSNTYDLIDCGPNNDELNIVSGSANVIKRCEDQSQQVP